MTEPAPIGEPAPKASLADWLAVAAGTLGALMALVDVSIVNASLPTIQGEIGATPSEGTWVGTAYLVAEIVVIPLVAWFERMLGLRRLLLGAALLFTLFSVVCGLSANLETMILGRIGQGLAGGVLIPAVLTIVARRLPPAQQPIGLAMTAMTALVGPAVGPMLGGWLTDNISWHYAFFMNVPICALQAVMILIAIRPSAGAWDELRQADWAGVLGMVVGLGAGTTLLEEGHREQWFDSPFIWRLAVATVIGAALVAYGQLTAERPVLRLALLRNRGLASAVGLMMVVGLLLFGCLFITPQFLAAVAGYNALRAGQVAALGGLAAIPTAMLYAALASRLDLRLIVALGMLLIALGVYHGSGMTAQSVGADFAPSLLLYGAGTTLASIPLQQAVLAAVGLDDVADANGMVSVARNLGGSIGLAAIAGIQDGRFDLHHWQINGAMSAADPALQQRLAETAQAFGTGPEATTAALRSIDGEVMLQALVMTFNDTFLIMTWVCLLFLPAVALLRVPARGTPLGLAMH
ncbi:MAG: DHA2 family efflux MFS transporter permease subunit [Sphingomonadales bacterium]|nr:DHA2 family efflux MFS transporter permease subunit [Sphingomonadales bacterium]